MISQLRGSLLPWPGKDIFLLSHPRFYTRDTPSWAAFLRPYFLPADREDDKIAPTPELILSAAALSAFFFFASFELASHSIFPCIYFHPLRLLPPPNYLSPNDTTMTSKTWAKVQKKRQKRQNKN
jgi:hypothetical protein